MKKIYLLLGLLLIAEWGIAQVKSEIKITTSKEYGDSFEMWPKSTSKEDTIFIDWGDGEIKKYNIDPDGIPYYTKVSGRIVGDTIRIFTQLVSLDCSGANVTSIQLINQPLLTQLNAANNELSTDNCILDGALNMKIVDLSKNQLTILDMRGYEKLQYFSAIDNENLSTVLFTDGSPALQSISMSNCDISHFYPVSLPALSSLSLAGGSLKELEVGEFYPNLSSLDISENYITELDVALCKQLTALNCDGNQLEKINVTQNPELLNLFCGNNRIKELNLSNNPKITNLGCNNNLLNTLDVSRLPNLTSLTCGQNYLKRLDLSQNAFLTKLYCNDNLLEFLDFAGNPRLDYVDCRNNAKMTACSLNYMFSTMLARYREPWGANLLIEGCNGEGANTEEINSEEMKWKTDVQGDGSAVCDSVVITLMPAENGTYHLEQPHLYGTDYREVSTKAMAGTPVKVIAKPDPEYAYRGVTVGDEMIADTFFVLKDAATVSVNFKSTIVPYITVDVAENTQMSFALQAAVENTEVTVDWGDGVEQTYTIETGWKRIDGYSSGKTVKITGPVTAANFESYPGMGIWDNQLTGIDVSHNSDLIYLSTYMNPIETLVVRNCLDLEYLDCSYCELSDLDITANTKLTTLKCYGNHLNKLDISGCIGLETLNAKNNNLSELNLSANNKLVFLDVQNNQLQQINVTGMPKLKEFAVSGNKLTEIDITNNSELAIFSVSTNQLTALDLSENKNIGKLQCANNKLASLDLSNQSGIYYLDCGGNGMTACALNDLYYSLPEYPQLDEPLKGYTLWVRGDDGTVLNDAEHAESIIAVGKGWLVNYEGDGSGCNEAYVTIKPSENGKVRLFDEAEKEIVSGKKAKKNSIITVKAEPEQGYDVVSIKANGQEIENEIFTIVRATDVVAKFGIAIGTDAPEKSLISIYGGKNEIKYDTSIPAEVAVYTLTGVQIYKETVSGNGHILLPAGSYLVTVHTGHANTSRVIIVG